MEGRECRIQNAGVRIQKLYRELILKDSYWGIGENSCQLTIINEQC